MNPSSNRLTQVPVDNTAPISEHLLDSIVGGASLPGMHKFSNITLKRGVIESTSSMDDGNYSGHFTQIEWAD